MPSGWSGEGATAFKEQIEQQLQTGTQVAERARKVGEAAAKFARLTIGENCWVYPHGPDTPAKRAAAEQCLKKIEEAINEALIRAAPRTRIGTVDPPPLDARGQLTTNAGSVMHQRVATMIQNQNPGIRYSTHISPRETGPDMRVVGRARGVRDPGYDYLEIKPNDGTGTFAYNQFGRPGRHGRGRLITYDNAGNVYQVDLPHPLLTQRTSILGLSRECAAPGGA